MSAMPTPAESPVVTRPSTPGFDMSEDEHIIEIDVESVLFDVSRCVFLLATATRGHDVGGCVLTRIG
jgi:hypothetical protein